jgi:hypothetical protein
MAVVEHRFDDVEIMPRARSWTDEQLVAAVAASRTLKEVHIRLGITPGKYDVLRAHIRRLGIDASHLPRASAGSPRSSRRFRDEDLIEAVRSEWTVYGNGDHTDNRLENLRILCPNCHAITDTWCGRNRAGVAQRQRPGS